MSGDYSIGSAKWPGVSKVIEEMGEVAQVLGKLIAADGQTEHWDGTDLGDRLIEEIADLHAALAFLINKNNLDWSLINARADIKGELFQKWHGEQAA